ncbi:MAG: hypothetical protein HZA90_02365 [Verrucomicrobia bacterium]|nr:hypothetical protein [Verrucomicrobiota bacterium]
MARACAEAGDLLRGTVVSFQEGADSCEHIAELYPPTGQSPSCPQSLSYCIAGLFLGVETSFLRAETLFHGTEKSPDRALIIPSSCGRKSLYRSPTALGGVENSLRRAVRPSGDTETHFHGVEKSFLGATESVDRNGFRLNRCGCGQTHHP